MFKWFWTIFSLGAPEPSCCIVDAVKQMSDLILITPCVERAALVDLPIITTNSNKIPAIP